MIAPRCPQCGDHRASLLICHTCMQAMIDAHARLHWERWERAIRLLNRTMP